MAVGAGGRRASETRGRRPGGGGFASQLFDRADSTRLGLPTATGWWLLAAGVLVHGARSRRPGTPTAARAR